MRDARRGEADHADLSADTRSRRSSAERTPPRCPILRLRRRAGRRLSARAARERVRGTVSYREAGAGPAVGLLHGIGNQSGSWMRQLAALAPRFRTIAWDAPGYGGSDRLAARVAHRRRLRRSLGAFLDSLEIERRCWWAARSARSMAGAFAASRPERVAGLVLLNPAGGYGLADPKEREERLATRLERLATARPRGHGAGVLARKPVANRIGRRARHWPPGAPRASVPMATRKPRACSPRTARRGRSALSRPGTGDRLGRRHHHARGGLRADRPRVPARELPRVGRPGVISRTSTPRHRERAHRGLRSELHARGPV